MNDRAVLDELTHFASHAIVKADTHGQHEIGFVDGNVGVLGAVHAEHVQRKRVIRGERAQTHHRGGHRAAQFFSQLHQQGTSVGTAHTAACIQDWATGRADELTAQLELGRRDRSNGWLGRGNLRRHTWRRIVSIRVAWIVLLDIFGDVDQYWTRPIPGRQGEGLLHHRRDISYTVNEKTLLGDGGRDRNDIHLLKGILAQEVRRNVAGNGDDRYRIAVGIGNAGHEVGRSGARGRQTDAHLSGGSGKSLSRMGGALFVLYADAADIVLLEHVENLQIGPAGIAEQHFDAFEFEALSENLRPAQGVGAVLRLNF